MEMKRDSKHIGATTPCRVLACEKRQISFVRTKKRGIQKGASFFATNTRRGLRVGVVLREKNKKIDKFR